MFEVTFDDAKHAYTCLLYTSSNFDFEVHEEPSLSLIYQKIVQLNSIMK